MPTLVVLAYRDETSAAAAGEQVQRLVRHLRIEPDTVAVVRRDRDGRFHLTTNHQPVAGELSWGIGWMLVFALLFAPPPDRQADAGLDALLELVAAGGLDGRVQAEIRERLGPGTSALFLALDGEEQTDRLVDVLGPYGGQALRTTMSADRLAALQEALHGAAEALALSGGRDPARGSG
ncbi:MAG TPA: DUF1269 domain-containing protein [Mycobacteriales bacterium]|jgi:uncharacterized membrane protein